MRITCDSAVSAPAVPSERPSTPDTSSSLPERLACGAMLLLLGAWGVAPAQQATGPNPPASTPTAAPAAEVSLQQVTVTGTRIRATTDFNTPTPTTVIDTATLQSLGIVNVGQTLTVTPSNVSTFTPANTGDAPYFIGSFIPDLRGLNPYFGSRTLTLVNTQRFVQTNQGDSVDLNFIPQILVSRIDVVTGGASAAYGSGAIAGVYNVILDNKLEGGKLDADLFQTSHSDARDRHVGAAFGHGLFDNRLHFVIGGEYENQDPLGCESARSWCARNQGAYQSQQGAPGVTTYAYGYNLRANQLGENGTFLLQAPPGPVPNPFAGATTTLQATPQGNGTTPFALGQQPLSTAPFSFGNVVPGGDGIPVNQYTMLMAPVNRGVVMGMLNWQATDYLSLKADMLWGLVKTQIFGQNVPSLNQFITPFNAFACPGSTIGSATCINANDPSLAAAVGSGAFINKDWTNQEPLPTLFTTDVKRFTFGVDGKIGDSSWTYDGYYEYGVTNRDQTVYNNQHLYASAMALDSVINPATGQPDCYVNVYGFNPNDPHEQAAGYALADPRIAQGCVPLNPFGQQPLSAAAAGYSFANLFEHLRYEQTVAAINATGNYFKGIGAGPFTLAAGYEFRQEKGENLDQPGQPEYTATDFSTQYGVSFGGTVTVHEGYLETFVPILKDLPAAHLLTIDLAGRESRYDNRALFGIPVLGTGDFIHNLTTWKGSLIWEPTDWLRFRGSQSRDARAANFRELYYAQIIHAGGVFGYCGPPGTFGLDPCTWNLLGNTDLQPETSDTTTLGIVLTPKDWISGLQFSADWFHIKVNNAIEQANPTLVTFGCLAGISTYCKQMAFGPAGVTAAGAPCDGSAGAAAYQSGCYNVTSISPTSYNGAFYEVKGIDFSLNYLLDLGAIGDINTRLLTTWMDTQIFQNCSAFFPGSPCVRNNILGQTGTGNDFLNDYTPDAKWRGSLMVTWSKAGLSITPNMVFVSHGIMDYLGITPAQEPLYSQVLAGNDANLGLHPMPINYVPSYFVFNLNTAYQFQSGTLSGLQLFAQVSNLFNKTPPFTGGATGFGPSNAYGGTNPIFFDTLGLAYRAGFRLSF